jgi:glutamate synthase domain-containing protein 3
MTGGVVYVTQWRQLNPDSVTARPVPAEDATQLRELVEEHHGRTGSRRAAELLADWETALKTFRQIVPKAPPAVAPPTPTPAEPETARV